MLAWFIVFCVSFCVLGIFWFVLHITDSKKVETVAYYLIVISIFLMIISVVGFILSTQDRKGHAFAELSPSMTYTAEWSDADGSVVVMKLRAGNAKQAHYYEIPKDKIIFWGEEDGKVPAKFKVLTDKEGKVYAFKEVE